MKPTQGVCGCTYPGISFYDETVFEKTNNVVHVRDRCHSHVVSLAEEELLSIFWTARCQFIVTAEIARAPLGSRIDATAVHCVTGPGNVVVQNAHNEKVESEE